MATPRKKNLKWLIGGAVIVAAVVAMASLNLGSNLVYFYTPAEAYAKSTELEGKNIKVGGMVKPGSVNWQAEALSLNFTMHDFNGHDITVAHKGTPPDMFKEGQGVVVEGMLAKDGKSMISKSLMVKHSEEYKKPDATHSVNKELLEKSMFKGDASK